MTCAGRRRCGGGGAEAVAFMFETSNLADGTQPPTQAGTSVATGGANVKGAWVELIAAAAVTDECYDVEININAAATSSTARNVLVDIGIGGVGAEVVLIPDLIGGPASLWWDPSEYPHGGLRYRFPLRVPAGSRVAARAQESGAVSTVHVVATVRGAPTGPIWAGTSVVAYGVDPATSLGTAVVPGVAAEGAWVALGNPIDPGGIKYVEVGVGHNSAGMNPGIVHVDIGSGPVSPPAQIWVRQVHVTSATNESITKGLHGRYAIGPEGDFVYARAQASGGPPAGIHVAAYGVS